MIINIELPDHVNEITFERRTNLGTGKKEIAVRGLRLVKEAQHNEPLRYGFQRVDDIQFLNEIVELVFYALSDEGIKNGRYWKNSNV